MNYETEYQTCLYEFFDKVSDRKIYKNDISSHDNKQYDNAAKITSNNKIKLGPIVLYLLINS